MTTNTKKPLVLQIVFAMLAIISILITNIFYEAITIQFIISLVAILFSLFYCINPSKKTKALIIMYYLFLIAISIVTIVNYSTVEYDGLLYQQDIDQMRLLNTINTIIFSLLPQVLMLIGFLKPKKILVCLIFVFLIILTGFSLVSIILNINHYPSSAVLTTSILGLTDDFYMIVLWFGIAVKQFFGTISNKEIVINEEKRIYSTENSLEKLKELFDYGEITPEEYNQKKNEIISKL